MKKIILNILILIGVVVVSCEKIDLSDEKNDNSLKLRRSSIFSYIETIQINNGIDCENNILIFPSWEKLWETADKLDEMIEYECDAFDAKIPIDITDDEYDTLADMAGFDEDNALIKFENDLGFCSLRRKIEILENDWLERQGDGEWSISEDPDNHFIFDETERTLFSRNTEVIIGDTKAAYVYYKLIDDFSWIEVHNWDLEAIIQISKGFIPSDNPNVIIIDSEKKENSQNSSDCKKHIKKTQHRENGPNRIKIKSKVINNDRWGAKKISALTVGYKKKKGKWKRSRTWITAGITGVYGTNNCILFQDCMRAFEKHKVKERKRRRVKAKITGHTYEGASLIIGIKPQKAYGYHKQGSIDLKLDYYDMY